MSGVRRLPSAISLLCSLFFAAVSPAQTIRGQLLDQDSEAPIEAALVVLIDSTGHEIRGVLTNEEGGFVLYAPGPGTYSLRAEHIGYRIQTSEPLPLAVGENRYYRMIVPVKAINLAGIEVEAERKCVVRPEQGLQTASLWEAARTVLNAVRWTERGEQYVHRVVRYHNELDPHTFVVRKQESDTMWLLATRPFVAANAADLIERGFVQEGVDGGRYYAPDAEVLLSDAFLDTHCFKVHRGGDEGLIGLAFEPVPSRDVTDVRGVLWLDKKTSALRFLEYRYTGLSIGVPTEDFGGRVEFQRLPTGMWIMASWSIRGPIIGVGGWGSRLVAIKEEGGSVIETLPVKDPRQP